MKLNMGAVRTFGHRAAPVWQASMLLLVYLGLDDLPKLAGIAICLSLIMVYIVIDVAFMLRQEQELYFQQNPEFQALRDEIRAIRNILDGHSKATGNRWMKTQDEP